MADAVKCPNCGYVYWAGYYENWGTCDKCNSDNNLYKGKNEPKLVNDYYIHTYQK